MMIYFQAGIAIFALNLVGVNCVDSFKLLI